MSVDKKVVLILRNGYANMVEQLNEILADTPMEAPATLAKPKTMTAKDALALFPKELADKLYFEAEKDHVILKPREYLGSETFNKIMAIVRQVGGEYVSAGKESHFRL